MKFRMKPEELKGHSDLKIDWLRDSQRRIDEKNQVLHQILQYCAPHADQMWAATIASMILGCDFREVKDAFEKAARDSASVRLKGDP